MKNKLTLFAFWAILSWGIAVRVLAVMTYPDAVLSPDSMSYIEPIHNFLFNHQGFNLDVSRTPVFSFFYALIILVFKNWFFFVIIQHIMGIAIAVLCYHILVRYFACNRAIGLFALAVLLLWPQLISYEMAMLSEFIFTFAVVASACLLYAVCADKTRRHMMIFFILLGLSVSGAVLSKPHSIIWAAMTVIWVLCLFPLWRKAQYLRYCLVFMLVFTVPIAAWVWYGKKKMNTLTVSYYYGSIPFAFNFHYMDYDSGSHADIKKKMEPYIEKYKKENPFSYDKEVDYALWAFYNQEGAIGLVNKFTNNDYGRSYEVMKDIALESILRHPSYIAGHVLHNLKIIYKDFTPDSRISVQDEYTQKESYLKSFPYLTEYSAGYIMSAFYKNVAKREAYKKTFDKISFIDDLFRCLENAPVIYIVSLFLALFAFKTGRFWMLIYLNLSIWVLVVSSILFHYIQWRYLLPAEILAVVNAAAGLDSVLRAGIGGIRVIAKRILCFL